MYAIILWKFTIYLRLGLKLNKIYSVLEFKQTRWLKHILNSTHKKE